MHIHLEAAQQHAVQSYSDKIIQINSIIYERSLIVSQQEIISNIDMSHIEDIDEAYVALLTQFHPEVIIIGHHELAKFPSKAVISELSQRHIGMECMSMGAACRTYNVLLSENRAVVAGFIF